MASLDRPKLLSQKKAKKYLEGLGYTETQGGKHNIKMEKGGCRPITLPRHRGQDYSKDFTAQIYREIDRRA
jgi:hypothetical protein